MSSTSFENGEARNRIQRSRQQYGRLLEDLRGVIVAGELPPGAALPSEHELGDRYALGRNTVRRVLAELAAAGLVETQPGKGSFVTAPAESDSRVHTLRLGMYYPSAQTAKLGAVLRAFEAAHPLIRVQPLRLHQQGFVDTVVDLTESGQGPDLVVLMNGMLPDLAPDRHFLDLGDFLDEHPEVARGAYPLVSQLFDWGGRQYALPIIHSPTLLAYDRGALRQAGIAPPDASWCWDDLLDAARQLTRRGVERVERYGFHVQLAATRWMPLVFAGGGGLVDPEATGGPHGRLSEPASRLALQRMIDLAQVHGVSGPLTPDLQGEALFVLRRAAMVVASLYGADLHQFGTAGIDWDVALLPGAGGAGGIEGVRARRHLHHATGIAVSRGTTQLRSAYAFLAFLCSRRGQELLCGGGFSLPVNRSVAESTTWPDPRLHPRHLRVYLEAMEENRQTPLFYSSAAAEAAHRELLLAFAGMEDVTPACLRADAAVEACLRRAMAPAAVTAVV